MEPELQKNLKKLVKWSTYVMVLLTIYLLFVYIFPLFMRIAVYFPVVFLPFIFAILLALMIEPVVNLFEKHGRFKRIWAVLCSLILVIGGFMLAVFMAVTVIIREMSALYRLAAAHSDQIIGQIMSSFGDFQLYYVQLNLPPQVENALQGNLQNGLRLVQELLSSSINALMQGFIKLPGILIFLTIATVAAFLIIKDRALIRTFVMGILPPSTREQSSRVITDLLKALSGFVRAYSILISITAVITMLALKILGVEYALTLGLLIGIMDILPVLGPGAIMVPWIIWEFMSGHAGMGISLLVVYLIISVTRQVLEPKIVGDSIGLHPLATLISLYVGLQLGGGTGLILGPVLVVIFIASYRAGLLDRWDWRSKQ
jgi:sporulation integral membrane protein YtvI